MEQQDVEMEDCEHVLGLDAGRLCISSNFELCYKNNRNITISVFNRDETRAWVNALFLILDCGQAVSSTLYKYFKENDCETIASKCIYTDDYKRIHIKLQVFRRNLRITTRQQWLYKKEEFSIPWCEKDCLVQFVQNVFKP